MEKANNNDYGQERVRQLLSGVPFFNEIYRDDAEQFDLLENNTRLWVAGSGDEVIRAGDVDSTLYFLLRGQLEVLADSPAQPPLYYVSPGEAFGTLSMLLGTPRSADIRVSESAREAVIASLDFNDFSEDDSPYTLTTRLAFYHMIVHHIRWTLEVKRMANPNHELVQSMRKLPVFHGEKGSQEELEALREQAQGLAELLCRWNEEGQGNTGALQLT
ncbi:cyclic nucleotide-binding domain-containing protein [Alcanivorax sp. S6407]|uniref:cyclic nucleotide-binding domain-containing protein n=1 Tax=Alcanivorax sp. S6407 TaxID=2926424 RepID=UPI001FF16B54|nr:cyclic nucleotide-binding domain-containing protein [Alcanivorax sp. S6407]MCK0153839.1 cyclic nucleotide-binding domain-containing protein [Alcanivorax sp. S6407]